MPQNQLRALDLLARELDRWALRRGERLVELDTFNARRLNAMSADLDAARTRIVAQGPLPPAIHALLVARAQALLARQMPLPTARGAFGAASSTLRPPRATRVPEAAATDAGPAAADESGALLLQTLLGLGSSPNETRVSRVETPEPADPPRAPRAPAIRREESSEWPTARLGRVALAKVTQRPARRTVRRSTIRAEAVGDRTRDSDGPPPSDQR